MTLVLRKLLKNEYIYLLTYTHTHPHVRTHADYMLA